MKKIFVVILALSLTAASCDLTSGTFSLTSPQQGVFASTDGGDSFHASDNVASSKNTISTTAVDSLAFDPSNPQTMYLASPSGIFKSTDNGQTWKFILSGLQTSDIALDPTNSQTIYAAGLAGTHGKVIKSLDGGDSWLDIYTEPSNTNSVQTVAVNPSDPTVILAGLFSGDIIRSNDAGQTWQDVTDVSDRMLRIRFASAKVAYGVALHNGLEESKDEGLTWTNLTQALTEQSSIGAPETLASEFFDFGLDLKQAGVVYLGAEEGLFRTVNDGKNWSFIKLPLKGSSLRASAVAVDPTNSNTIYVSVDSTLFKSVNGGVTWETKVLPISTEVHSIIINPQSDNLIYLGVGSVR